MDEFVYVGLPTRVVLGVGALDKVPDEIDLLGIEKVLLIATKAVRDDADLLEIALKDRFAGRIDDVRQHVPIERAEAARNKAKEVDAQGIVAIGGGSAIGLAKAIALTTRLPIVAVPTTYAGSEMTPVWGLTAEGTKTTGSSLDVLPKTVVYDPLLSRRLPLKVTAASVANALAHCAEATWTPKANPITDVTAVEGVRALSEGLRAATTEPTDLEARSNLLYGACLAGSTLAQAGTSLHHKLCHLLGGTYDLPHAETHAAVLPQVTRVKALDAPRAKVRLEAALETDDLATGLYDLFTTAQVPTSLKELGLTEGQAREAADKFAPDDPEVLDILIRAWAGQRPEGAAR
ncbi:maleylacetate reductase [Kribbella sp. VKM Ac-2527]|uniref:Maleylacetate reductase n=1 Tax=Kribbella caucasensis TaxID=2512215 RepID=A0A4V3CB45_9ACTN|nr:maleylacetate reductase [Kribbella sp. VKM Ac-2527]TDO54480.1 maleylacetate reductase [Kribbella sp. VKM Ac-2527]